MVSLDSFVTSGSCICKPYENNLHVGEILIIPGLFFPLPSFFLQKLCTNSSLNQINDFKTITIHLGIHDILKINTTFDQNVTKAYIANPIENLEVQVQLKTPQLKLKK